MPRVKKAKYFSRSSAVSILELMLTIVQTHQNWQGQAVPLCTCFLKLNIDQALFRTFDNCS